MLIIKWVVLSGSRRMERAGRPTSSRNACHDSQGSSVAADGVASRPYSRRIARFTVSMHVQTTLWALVSESLASVSAPSDS
jgi:hypothetical protein